MLMMDNVTTTLPAEITGLRIHENQIRYQHTVPFTDPRVDACFVSSNPPICCPALRDERSFAYLNWQRIKD